MRKVSIYLKVQAQYALAELFLQQLVAILEAFIANTPQERLGLANLAFADALIEMASTCWSQGKYNEAEKLYQHGLAILTSMEVPQDEKDTFNHLHIKCLWHLGSIYTVRGWHTKAESLLEQAVDFIQNVIDAKSDDYPTLLLNLAGIYVDQGKFKEAQTLYKKLIRKAKRTYGSNSYLVAMLSGRLARLYLDLDQRRNYTEAETLLQQALLFTTQDQPEHPHATSIYHDLGDLYLKQEKFVQAEEMYYQALSIDQKIFGNAHLVVASDLGQLATLNYEQNRFDEALSLRKEEMSILQKMWGEQHLDVAA
ncbi:MAG TPA: tetratricopeptide repeat protein, partial [Methylomirabilota bacterium]|nr:tetratricopeptide repeat protein [Methylomirabilota bacterium]